jgi:hypothetical protein
MPTTRSIFVKDVTMLIILMKGKPTPFLMYVVRGYISTPHPVRHLDTETNRLVYTDYRLC